LGRVIESFQLPGPNIYLPGPKYELPGLVPGLVEEMEVSGKREVGRPRKTWKDVVKRDLELIRVEACGIGSRKMEKDHCNSDPCLK